MEFLIWKFLCWNQDTKIMIVICIYNILVIILNMSLNVKNPIAEEEINMLEIQAKLEDLGKQMVIIDEEHARKLHLKCRGTPPPPFSPPPRQRGGGETQPTKNCAKNCASGIRTNISVNV